MPVPEGGKQNIDPGIDHNSPCSIGQPFIANHAGQHKTGIVNQAAACLQDQKRKFFSGKTRMLESRVSFADGEGGEGVYESLVGFDGDAEVTAFAAEVFVEIGKIAGVSAVVMLVVDRSAAKF